MRPGHENLVAMGAISTVADAAIRDGVRAAKRNCFFQDEYRLVRVLESTCTWHPGAAPPVLSVRLHLRVQAGCGQRDDWGLYSLVLSQVARCTLDQLT